MCGIFKNVSWYQHKPALVRLKTASLSDQTNNIIVYFYQFVLSPPYIHVKLFYFMHTLRFVNV